MVPTFLALFVFLHLGHVLGDFLLQTDKLATAKLEPGAYGLVATLVHGAHLLGAQAIWILLGGLLLDIEFSITGIAVALAVNAATHVLIDWNRRGPRWWCQATGSAEFYEKSAPTEDDHAHTHGALHVDQALHYQLTGIAALLGVLL